MIHKDKHVLSESPIDFVVLWVDGNDLAWQSEKQKYASASHVGSCDHSTARYRDWNHMKYWFRAVEAFAPWVRTIHFVTWGHLPDFLNPNAPKLHIVNHRDFISHDCLPLFNSTAIEVNIHKIPGLAEHFVYFNDDMFLMRPSKPEHFFRGGLPCDTLTETALMTYGDNASFYHHLLNNMTAVNRHFDKRTQLKKMPFKYLHLSYGLRNLQNLQMCLYPVYTAFRYHHLPEPYLKSSWEKVWKQEYALLEQTSYARFRTNYDFNQHLFKFWRLAEGEFAPIKRSGKCFHISEQNIDGICQELLSKKNTFICFHDSDDIHNFQICQDTLISTLDTLLPNKSAFEL